MGKVTLAAAMLAWFSLLLYASIVRSVPTALVGSRVVKLVPNPCNDVSVIDIKFSSNATRGGIAPAATILIRLSLLLNASNVRTFNAPYGGDVPFCC